MILYVAVHVVQSWSIDGHPHFIFVQLEFNKSEGEGLARQSKCNHIPYHPIDQDPNLEVLLFLPFISLHVEYVHMQLDAEINTLPATGDFSRTGFDLPHPPDQSYQRVFTLT